MGFFSWLFSSSPLESASYEEGARYLRSIGYKYAYGDFTRRVFTKEGHPPYSYEKGVMFGEYGWGKYRP